MLKRFGTFVKAHKVISLVVVVVVVGGGYYWYNGSHGATAVTKYVIQDATQGTVVASVTASGQINPVTSIDVKPQVSENVTKIYVQVGDQVTEGEPLVQLDDTNEEQALNQAQLSFQQAQLNLDQLTQISTTTLLGDQDSVTRDGQALVTASATLTSDYQSGFDTISSAFVSLQAVMTGLQDFVQGNDISKVQADPDAYVSLMPNYLQPSTLPYSNALIADYNAALTAYQQNLVDYHATDRTAAPATLDALFSETYNTVELVSNATKDANDLINYVINNYPKDAGLQALPSVTNTFQTNFGNYTNTADSEVTSIQGVITGLLNDKNGYANDGTSLEEASETLAELVGGPTQTDLLSQQISIQSAQNNLQTAENNLAYTTIRAPIAGEISAVDAVVGETVASPAVSIVGTGNEADVTLNEVDAAKVQVGNQATLTFDALPDVSLAGTVTEVDPVGTVSQGVVNYTVEIGFSQPANTSSSNLVKPGMTVTAAIVTQADQNVIAVPNSAVTTVGGASYVLEPATPVSADVLAASATGGVVLSEAPTRVPVTTGLSNNTMTEITSGVNAGDQIITQTLTTSASTAPAATGGTSALRALGGGAGATFGGGGGGGGGTFVGGGARGG
ncbi:MAG TPA: HlyD family efflux transporter periplasmic adaptor subunit [Candidatus Paceibacterota bacterium]|jgi:multidrug efflux pump subunit AcrA (membrane-fusion protein)|nr:HlyD family efflux transporter periplasmic adaptor subunit [Candidatus Paceibacterota bacterium]